MCSFTFEITTTKADQIIKEIAELAEKVPVLSLEHGGNRAYRFVCGLFILAVHSDVVEERSVHTTHALRFSPGD
jgi:hypothetical protein